MASRHQPLLKRAPLSVLHSESQQRSGLSVSHSAARCAAALRRSPRRSARGATASLTGTPLGASSTRVRLKGPRRPLPWATNHSLAPGSFPADHFPATPRRRSAGAAPAGRGIAHRRRQRRRRAAAAAHERPAGGEPRHGQDGHRRAHRAGERLRLQPRAHGRGVRGEARGCHGGRLGSGFRGRQPLQPQARARGGFLGGAPAQPATPAERARARGLSLLTPP